MERDQDLQDDLAQRHVAMRPALMVRGHMEEEVERREGFIEYERQRDRYDFAYLRQQQYRLRQLDVELLRRDLGGC